MKYCVVIVDGAAGWPLPERGNKTSLELARTPHLDAMAREGLVGLTRTIPDGLEPSSDNACMSILGYDPGRYHQGRAAIEARSMGIAADSGALFRANLVAVRDGRMHDYSGGHITSEEAGALIAALNENLGGDGVCFYPGVSYRNICKLTGHDDTLGATCTPPHDIPGRSIREFLPDGPGSGLLRDLMRRSEAVLAGHHVNRERQQRGLPAANMLWLFWGSGQATPMPDFRKRYGVRAAITSAVDVLRGLALMVGLDLLDLSGVTDNLDNDFAGQGRGALEALDRYDLVVIHIEATDEAGHAGGR
ncbi:MAG: 2,3-bisphosphoglycerate-independent phosphoglycerate mutase [Chloroflexota bacterium]